MIAHTDRAEFLAEVNATGHGVYVHNDEHGVEIDLGHVHDELFFDPTSAEDMDALLSEVTEGTHLIASRDEQGRPFVYVVTACDERNAAWSAETAAWHIVETTGERFQ